jgi:CheY-like chemotaxis protein
LALLLPIAPKEGISAFMGIQPEKARSKLILVVDDDAMHLKLVNKALSNRGYQVYEACDGVEAIRIARREVRDIILLDLGLPLRDGYEVMERLKVTGSTEKIPVVVFSAQPAATEQEEAKRIGAVAYVEKQIKIDALCSLIAETLHEVKTAH